MWYNNDKKTRREVTMEYISVAKVGEKWGLSERSVRNYCAHGRIADVAFERIHPFQDGNGRVGRLILFKECLKHNIVPFIIEDNLKLFYYRGLHPAFVPLCTKAGCCYSLCCIGFFSVVSLFPHTFYTPFVHLFGIEMHGSM